MEYFSYKVKRLYSWVQGDADLISEVLMRWLRGGPMTNVSHGRRVGSCAQTSTGGTRNVKNIRLSLQREG